MAPATKVRPVTLCVDLDGTLLKTDLLFESLALLLKHKPWLILLIPFWCLRGRAALTRSIARHVSVDVASLPYHDTFLDWLRSQKVSGRPLYLITATDQSLSSRIADHLGLFDRVLASDGRLSLKGLQSWRCYADIR